MSFEFLLIPGGAFLAALAVGSAGFGIVDARMGVNFLWCLPAIAAASRLGLWLYGHLDERRFHRIVLWLLLVLGLTLLI